MNSLGFHPEARTGCCAAAAGTTTPGTAGQLTATTIPLATGTATTAFVLPVSQLRKSGEYRLADPDEILSLHAGQKVLKGQKVLAGQKVNSGAGIGSFEPDSQSEGSGTVL